MTKQEGSRPNDNLLRTVSIGAHPKEIVKEDQQRLLAAIRNGDKEAFTGFYMKYADSLVSFLTRLTSSEEDAKEIAQEAFASLWEKRESLDPHTTLGGYLFGVAKNLSSRLFRERNKASAIANEIFASGVLYDDSADEQLISLETSLLIQAALNNMPAQRRRVYEMSREEGLGHNEIAKKLGISVRTVERHIYNVTKELKELLLCLILLFLF